MLKKISFSKLVGYVGGNQILSEKLGVSPQAITNIKLKYSSASLPLALRIQKIANEEGFEIDLNELSNNKEII